MKQRLLACVLGVILLLGAPATTLAQKQQVDPDAKPDARLETFAEQVKLPEPGTTALTWLLLVGLGVICFAVMFKNAKRTHLD